MFFDFNVATSQEKRHNLLFYSSSDILKGRLINDVAFMTCHSEKRFLESLDDT